MKQKVGFIAFCVTLFVALILPAQAQFNPSLVGRGPEPVNLFQVTFKTIDGKRVGRGGQMSALPPVGYVYKDSAGTLYLVVGGEFGDTACSSTRCAVRATVFVDKE